MKTGLKIMQRNIGRDTNSFFSVEL